MSRLKKLQNPFIQQYVIEILFPLLGYFFFDWDILIIGVYYLIDHFCAQVLFFRRAHWVNTRASKVSGIHHLILAILLFGLLFFAELVLLVYFLMEAKVMTLEAVSNAFLVFAKEELWFLFPVVLFVYHFKDQFTFYMPRHYLKYKFIPFLWWDTVRNGFVLTLLGLFGLLWIQLKINDLFVIFIFLILKIGFDLTAKKFFEEQSLID